MFITQLWTCYKPPCSWGNEVEGGGLQVEIRLQWLSCKLLCHLLPLCYSQYHNTKICIIIITFLPSPSVLFFKVLLWFCLLLVLFVVIYFLKTPTQNHSIVYQDKTLADMYGMYCMVCWYVFLKSYVPIWNFSHGKSGSLSERKSQQQQSCNPAKAILKP